MNTEKTFKIYDASAGSGKTFSLVREYLSLILGSTSPGYYKNLLALTFTNKAVAEMKERIVNNLIEFSKQTALDNPPDMMLAVAKILNVSLSLLQQRSHKALQHLLHNYASFSVETIDSFNHRLIRTFARDLKLPTNFEVVLDTESLLIEAIDKLISKTGEEDAITNVLVDFTLEKADDDKSWDISKDILKTSKLLNNENDAAHVAKLKDKTLTNFLTLKKELYKKIAFLETTITEASQQLLQVLHTNGLDQASFSGGYFYKHFEKLAQGNFSVNYGAKWQDMAPGTLYTKATAKNKPEIATTIDGLLDSFITVFSETKKALYQIYFLEAILKNLTPLSVINLVSKEIETIKEEQGLVPISQFNELIHNEIKNQPAPFIYERLGERYRHYFIDEFQDTSMMQWNNIIPLIDSSLSQAQSSEEGSLLLVGDVKQSIYRWRGGNPEQFLALINKYTPFPGITAHVENLETNYRSFSQIIDFNNDFFTFVANHFGDALHKKLYLDGNKQQTNNNKGGYVQLEFIDAENTDEKDLIYCEKTYTTLTHLFNNGFEPKDICVLTRRKKDGVTLSTYLMEKGVDVISAETLLLRYSKLVNCIINTIHLTQNPQNNEVKVALLDYLHTHFKIAEEKHTFFKKFINKSNPSFSEILKEYHIDFDVSHATNVSIYECVEYIIKQWQLDTIADAYLFSFMDVVFEYSQQPLADTIGFLTLWETKSSTLSIATGSGINGVQFMTVHKAKGLEFPVVVFPYADVDLYKEIEPKTWMQLPQGISNTFDEALISYNNNVANYGEEGAQIFRTRRNTLELDTLNILYVTLTRPVEQLYIFTAKPTAAKEGYTTFNHLFAGFLQQMQKWNDEQVVYTFGEFTKKREKTTNKGIDAIVPEYISSTPQDHNMAIITTNATLWNDATAQAIAAGNLFHETMQRITYHGDETAILKQYDQENILPKNLLKQLENTINNLIYHPKLSSYFTNKWEVENEREIITKEGFMIIPDRLVFDVENNSVCIIDYKTGVPDYTHEDQINGYATALVEMGFKVSEKILVYTHDGITINIV